MDFAVVGNIIVARLATTLVSMESSSVECVAVLADPTAVVAVAAVRCSVARVAAFPNIAVEEFWV